MRSSTNLRADFMHWRHLASLRGPRRRLDPRWYLRGDAVALGRGLVIGGASRSGTTLVRMILDSHPEIACGPESDLLCGAMNERALSERYDVSRARIRAMERASASFPDFIATFLSEHAARQGASVWAEKTPSNILNAGWILNRFPEVQFLHIVRDGRAVVNSLRTHPRTIVRRGRAVPNHVRRDLAWCIARWRRMVESGLDFDTHPRVVRVAYEDVLTDPRTALEPVLARIGQPWHPDMERHHLVAGSKVDPLDVAVSQNALGPIDPAAAERWRTALTAAEIAEIEGQAGDLLDRLGYPRVNHPQAERVQPATEAPTGA